MPNSLPRPSILCLVALLTACGGAEERKAEHLAKAIQYFDANNVEKADVEFRRVLQIDPNSASPYYYLGRIEEQKKNWGQAFGLYQKAVELDPNNNDARLKLAQFLVFSREPDKALEQLAPLEKAKPNDIDVRLLRAAIASQKGDDAAAGRILAALVAERVKRSEPYLLLAALEAKEGHPRQADATLAAGLAVIPDAVGLLTALARSKEQQEQWAEAESLLRRLIAVEPKQFSHRALLAEAFLLRTRWDDTEATLRTAVADFPDDPRAFLMLADYFARRGRVDQAVTELTAAVAAHPHSFELAAALAGALEKAGQFSAAERTYSDFIAANETSPEAVKARVQLAGFEARRGRAADSEALVDRILKENPRDYEALLLKGRLALAGNKAEEAITAFRAILKDQPDSVEAMGLLADALQRDGKTALVQETLETAVRMRPSDMEPRRKLVQWLVQQGRHPEALAEADAYLALQPGSLDGYNLKADVLAASHQVEALEALLREIKDKFPRQPIGPFRLGAFYQARKNLGGALAEYEQALMRSPNDYESLRAVVAIALELKEPGRAEAWLRKGLAAGEQAGTWQLMGTLALGRGQGEAGVRALEKAIAINPHWLLPYAELGAWLARQGDMNGAAGVARRAVAEAPGDFPARAALADYLARAGKTTEAEAVLRDFLATADGGPEAARARDLLAGLYTRMGRAEEGGKLFDQRLAAHPEDRQAALRKAQLALANGQTAVAVSLLEGIVAANPRASDALTLLAAAYQTEGHGEKVAATLEQAVKVKPEDVGLRRNLVQYLIQEKLPDAALAQAEAGLAAQPGSVEALTLKADVLAALGRDVELEAILKEIRSRLPNSPLVAFRLGKLYQSHKRYDEAVAEYETALNNSQNALEPLRALISVHLEQGQPAKAEARLQKVLAGNPKHGGAYQLLGMLQAERHRPAEAAQSLRKAIEVSPKWLPPYATLGVLYEQNRQFDQAIAVYRQALTAEPGDPAITLALARALELARRPDEAMTVYKDFLKTHTDNLLAVNNLAVLLGASGDPARIEEALRLSKPLENSSEPAFLDTLAWLRYRVRDFDGARALQEKVVDRAPDNPIFRYHLGMIYLLGNDRQKAKEQLAMALEKGPHFPEAGAAREALQQIQ